MAEDPRIEEEESDEGLPSLGRTSALFSAHLRFPEVSRGCPFLSAREVLSPGPSAVEPTGNAFCVAPGAGSGRGLSRWPEGCLGSREGRGLKPPGNAGPRSLPSVPQDARPFLPIPASILVQVLHATVVTLTPDGLPGPGSGAIPRGDRLSAAERRWVLEILPRASTSPETLFVCARPVKARVWGRPETSRLHGTRALCTSQSGSSPAAQKQVWKSLDLDEHPRSR